MASQHVHKATHFSISLPRKFTSDPPSQDLAISLLFAADTLACYLVFGLAKRHLSEIWDGHILPATDDCNVEDRTYPSAIKLARQYAMPGILRRACYELLSSQAFWDALGPLASQAALDALRISEEDVRTLFSARVTLGALWREFVMQVPEGTTYGYYQRSLYDMRWCCHHDEKTRAGAWRSFVVDKGALEVCDPLRGNFLAEWEGELKKGKRCQACADRKRRAEEEKRREWWERMDELFGL